VEEVAAQAPATADAPPAPPAEPIQAESVAVEAPAAGEAPEEVHQANAVSSWTTVPQIPAPALPIDPAADGAAIHDLQLPQQNLNPSHPKDLGIPRKAQSVSV